MRRSAPTAVLLAATAGAAYDGSSRHGVMEPPAFNLPLTARARPRGFPEPLVEQKQDDATSRPSAGRQAGGGGDAGGMWSERQIPLEDVWSLGTMQQPQLHHTFSPPSPSPLPSLPPPSPPPPSPSTPPPPPSPPPPSPPPSPSPTLSSSPLLPSPLPSPPPSPLPSPPPSPLPSPLPSPPPAPSQLPPSPPSPPQRLSDAPYNRLSLSAPLAAGSHQLILSSAPANALADGADGGGLLEALGGAPALAGRHLILENGTINEELLRISSAAPNGTQLQIELLSPFVRFEHLPRSVVNLMPDSFEPPPPESDEPPLTVEQLRKLAPEQLAHALAIAQTASEWVGRRTKATLDRGTQVFALFSSFSFLCVFSLTPFSPYVTPHSPHISAFNSRCLRSSSLRSGSSRSRIASGASCSAQPRSDAGASGDAQRAGARISSRSPSSAFRFEWGVRVRT